MCGGIWQDASGKRSCKCVLFSDAALRDWEEREERVFLAAAAAADPPALQEAEIVVHRARQQTIVAQEFYDIAAEQRVHALGDPAREVEVDRDIKARNQDYTRAVAHERRALKAREDVDAAITVATQVAREARRAHRLARADHAAVNEVVEFIIRQIEAALHARHAQEEEVEPALEDAQRAEFVAAIEEHEQQQEFAQRAIEAVRVAQRHLRGAEEALEATRQPEAARRALQEIEQADAREAEAKRARAREEAAEKARKEARLVIQPTAKGLSSRNWSFVSNQRDSAIIPTNNSALDARHDDATWTWTATPEGGFRVIKEIVVLAPQTWSSVANKGVRAIHIIPNNNGDLDPRFNHAIFQGPAAPEGWIMVERRFGPPGGSGLEILFDKEISAKIQASIRVLIHVPIGWTVGDTMLQAAGEPMRLHLKKKRHPAVEKKRAAAQAQQPASQVQQTAAQAQQTAAQDQQTARVVDAEGMVIVMKMKKKMRASGIL